MPQYSLKFRTESYEDYLHLENSHLSLPENIFSIRFKYGRDKAMRLSSLNRADASVPSRSR